MSCLLLLIRNQCRGTLRLVATYLHTNLPASSFNVKATVCAISHAVKLMLNRMGHNFPLCLWLWHTHTFISFIKTHSDKSYSYSIHWPHTKHLASFLNDKATVCDISYSSFICIISSAGFEQSEAALFYM